MFAKVFVFCAVVAAAHGMGLMMVDTGKSISSRKQDAMGNYAFGYDTVHGKGASNSRAEVGDGYGNKKGSYTIADIDERVRKVEYIADKLGFRAFVKTNEPGTAMSAPAAAAIISPYAASVAPVAKAIAPVPAPILAAAPIATIGYEAGIAVPLGLVGNGLGLEKGLSLGVIGNGYGVGLLINDMDLGMGVGKSLLL